MFDFDGDGPATRQKRYKRTHGNHGDIAGQKQRARGRKTALRRRCVAILDLETNPFNNETEEYVLPFLAILYSDQFDPVIMWCEDWKALVNQIVAAINALPDKYTIYAHNGGRFDYMFLIHELRGAVMFKGRAIMRANIGPHEIRDSLHIIPESLKNASDKNEIDYRWFAVGVRHLHRQAIIDYCLSDCRYTFEIVRAFIDRFGLPMTIGQCAMKELKKHYTFERLGNHVDAYLREYFFGGRTECIASAGAYHGDYRLYDVHSMYPSVMAYTKHPIGAEFLVNDRITPRTAFLHIHCDNPAGALMVRDDDGSLTSKRERGEFKISIHEYNTATALKLISKVSILRTIDFQLWSAFDKFVIPLYTERMRLKELVVTLPEGAQKKRTEQDIKFFKYLLNNCYGKFAQNPRRFKEYFITDPEDMPPTKWLYSGVEQQFNTEKFADPELTMNQVRSWRDLPEIENDRYWIWSHPCPEWRFNNVATAASITGAARAKLLEAIHSATDPLYCDTDSLICRAIGDLRVTDSELGTWHLEQHISDVVITGKKMYGYKIASGKKAGEIVIRSKGIKGVTWQDLLDMNAGKVISKTMLAPTISRNQEQKYITRELRKTAA